MNDDSHDEMIVDWRWDWFLLTDNFDWLAMRGLTDNDILMTVIDGWLNHDNADW